MTEIPLEMVLGGREISEPKVSPNGATVALLTKWGKQTAIVSMASEGGPERIVSAGQQPAFGRGPFGGNLAWLPDGDALVFLGADGNLWRQPYPGGAAEMIADVGDERRAGGLTVSTDGRFALVAVDDAEIWRIPLDGTPARRIDDGADDFVADPFPFPDGSGALWTAWNVPDMPWDGAAVRTVVFDSGERDGFVGSASVHQPRILPDGRRTGVRDDGGWLNVYVGDEHVVNEMFEHSMPTWGSGQRSYVASPDGERIAFWRNERGFGTLNVVEIASGVVTEVDRGVFSHLDWRGNTLAALRSGAKTLPQVVTYRAADDYERRKIAFGSVAGWERFDLPEPELIEVAADGATLHARRYRAGMGRMLVWVHGGPTGQWPVEWNPKISYWWSRGWDIYIVDPRGSSGHGRDYQQALNGTWGDLDVADTATLIRHAHREGWAEPSSTAIMGGSSGGLTVLGVLAHHGDLVAAGVALYPVTDLAILAEKSHRYEAHYTIPLVGPLDDHEAYERLSPMSSAHLVRRPTLVLHGSDDPVVPLESTVRYVETARRAGADIEFHIFEGEGHGFRDPENKQLEYERIENFLADKV